MKGCSDLPLDQLQSARDSASHLNLSLQRNAEFTVMGIRSVLISEHSQLVNKAEQTLFNAREQTTSLKNSMLHNGSEAVLKQRHRLQHLHHQAITSTSVAINAARHGVEKLESIIQHLNPSKILERGFALVFSSDGDVINTTQQLSENQEFKIRLRDGTITAVCKEKNSEDL